MKRLLTLLLVSVAAACATTTVDAQTRTNIPALASLPATCRVGDVVTKTGASAGLYRCSATNTWTLIVQASTAPTLTGTNFTGVPGSALTAGSVAASKLTGTDIATVGTITAGVWNGTIITAAFGGTGQSTFTKGDLLAASGAATLSKLAAGTDGKILSANSATATGLEWIAAPGGGDALTASSLAQFAATTSAQLAGVLSDETGSGGGFMRATAPTMATATINGVNYAQATKTADYTLTATDRTIFADASGTSVTITLTLPTASGIGGRTYTVRRTDTDTDGTVTIDPNASETIDGAATRALLPGSSLTFQSNGTNWLSTTDSGTSLADPGADRIFFFRNSTKLPDFLTASTGLTISGTNLTIDSTVATLSGSQTLTNKTYDVEGTGNVFTDTVKWMYAVAVCQGSTASLALSALTGLAPTPTCITGTNVTKGWANFPDSAGAFELQGELLLPADWTGAVDINGLWRTSATSGDIKLYVTVACTADAEGFNDTWVAAGNTTETAKGTGNQLNAWSVSGLTTTGCAAGEVMHWRVYRDRADAADTLAAAFDLGPITFTARRAK